MYSAIPSCIAVHVHTIFRRYYKTALSLDLHIYKMPGFLSLPELLVGFPSWC